VTVFTIQGIVADAAKEVVKSIAAMNDVVSGIANQYVRIGAAVDIVVAVPTVNAVFAVTAIHFVSTDIPIEDIIPSKPVNGAALGKRTDLIGIGSTVDWYIF